MNTEKIIHELQARIMTYRKQEADAIESIKEYGDDGLNLPDAYSHEAEFYEQLLYLVKLHESN